MKLLTAAVLLLLNTSHTSAMSDENDSINKDLRLFRGKLQAVEDELAVLNEELISLTDETENHRLKKERYEDQFAFLDDDSEKRREILQYVLKEARENQVTISKELDDARLFIASNKAIMEQIVNRLNNDKYFLEYVDSIGHLQLHTNEIDAKKREISELESKITGLTRYIDSQNELIESNAAANKKLIEEKDAWSQERAKQRIEKFQEIEQKIQSFEASHAEVVEKIKVLSQKLESDQHARDENLKDSASHAAIIENNGNLIYEKTTFLSANEMDIDRLEDAISLLKQRVEFLESHDCHATSLERKQIVELRFNQLEKELKNIRENAMSAEFHIRNIDQDAELSQFKLAYETQKQKTGQILKALKDAEHEITSLSEYVGHISMIKSQIDEDSEKYSSLLLEIDSKKSIKDDLKRKLEEISAAKAAFKKDEQLLSISYTKSLNSLNKKREEIMTKKAKLEEQRSKLAEKVVSNGLTMELLEKADEIRAAFRNLPNKDIDDPAVHNYHNIFTLESIRDIDRDLQKLDSELEEYEKAHLETCTQLDPKYLGLQEETQKSYEHISRELDDLAVVAKSLQSSRDGAIEQLNNFNKALEECERKSTGINERIEILKKEYEQAQAHLDEVQKTYESEKERTKVKLEESFAALMEQKRMFEAEYSELTNEKQAMSEERDSYLESARKDLNEASDRLGGILLCTNELRSDIEKLQTELDTSLATKKELDCNLAYLESEIATATEELDNLSSKRDQLAEVLEAQKTIFSKERDLFLAETDEQMKSFDARREELEVSTGKAGEEISATIVTLEKVKSKLALQQKLLFEKGQQCTLSQQRQGELLTYLSSSSDYQMYNSYRAAEERIVQLESSYKSVSDRYNEKKAEFDVLDAICKDISAKLTVARFELNQSTELYDKSAEQLVAKKTLQTTLQTQKNTIETEITGLADLLKSLGGRDYLVEEAKREECRNRNFKGLLLGDFKNLDLEAIELTPVETLCEIAENPSGQQCLNVIKPSVYSGIEKKRATALLFSFDKPILGFDHYEHLGDGALEALNENIAKISDEDIQGNAGFFYANVHKFPRMCNRLDLFVTKEEEFKRVQEFCEYFPSLHSIKTEFIPLLSPECVKKLQVKAFENMDPVRYEKISAEAFSKLNGEQLKAIAVSHSSRGFLPLASTSSTQIMALEEVSDENKAGHPCAALKESFAYLNEASKKAYEVKCAAAFEVRSAASYLSSSMSFLFLATAILNL